MLRVHFTPDDIARVRVAAGPDHLWEIVNSFQGLFDGGDAPTFGQWRHLVRPRLGGPADRLLAGLLPGRGYLPDFLTPAPGTGRELAAALDTVLGTPRTALRRDLTLLAASPSGAARYRTWPGRSPTANPRPCAGWAPPCTATTGGPSPRSGRRSAPRSTPTGPPAPAPSWRAVPTGCWRASVPCCAGARRCWRPTTPSTVKSA